MILSLLKVYKNQRVRGAYPHHKYSMAFPIVGARLQGTPTCTKRPTFQEMTINFVNNEAAFSELSNIVYSIGLNETSFSYKIAENHNERNGQRNHTVVYYLHGFASSGMVYTYVF